MNFTKRVAFTLSVSVPITALAADKAAKTLCLATGNGIVLVVKPEDETSNGEWQLASKDLNPAS